MRESIERYEPTGRFWQWSLGVLRSYARNLSPEHFRRRYPGLTDEAIAGRRIRSAALSAAATGLAFGALISLIDVIALASTLETFVSGFLSSPITIPTLVFSIPLLVITIIGEMSLVVRTQIRLACDLFILYRLPADPDDQEQSADIISVALGLSGASLSGRALRRAAEYLPGSSQASGKMAYGQVRARLRGWMAGQLAGQITGQFVRKYLLGGLAVRALIPGSSLVTATLWDFFTTRAVGETLRVHVRGRRMIQDMAGAIALNQVQSPDLLLRTLLAMALTDGGLKSRELTFYSQVVERLQREASSAEMDILGQAPDLKWKDVVVGLAEVADQDEKLALYNAAFDMATVAGHLAWKKRRRVQQLAGLYDIPFDRQKFQAQADLFKEPQPARTILLLILLLFALVIATALLCMLAAVSPLVYYWLTIAYPQNL
jgi:hypothetical protein